MKKRRLKPKKRKLKKAYFILLIAFIFFGILLLYQTCPQSQKKEIRGTSLKILSPLNKTYDTNSVILHVAASKELAWMKNSIDGGKNITACYKCNSYQVNFLQFNKGSHLVTVYAGDYRNKTIKTSVVFTVV